MKLWKIAAGNMGDGSGVFCSLYLIAPVVALFSIVSIKLGKKKMRK